MKTAFVQVLIFMERKAVYAISAIKFPALLLIAYFIRLVVYSD